MHYKLQKIPELSGAMASIYTVVIDGTDKFGEFLEENNNSHISEIKDILSRLQIIGKKTGAREHYFKIHEGKPGDGVCALYDPTEKKLRLYCIRFGNQIVILGGGGPKPKNIHALQEDAKLNDENALIRKLSKSITQNLHQVLEFSKDYLCFEGCLEIDDEM